MLQEYATCKSLMKTVLADIIVRRAFGVASEMVSILGGYIISSKDVCTQLNGSKPSRLRDGAFCQGSGEHHFAVGCGQDHYTSES